MMQCYVDGVWLVCVEREMCLVIVFVVKGQVCIFVYYIVDEYGQLGIVLVDVIGQIVDVVWVEFQID